jgi:hypothetical protein
MWTWIDKEKMAALYVVEDEESIFCGINVEPLLTWLAQGNEPEEYDDDL